MNKFTLTVSSPDGNLFKDDVIKLTLRGAEGDLAVLAGHTPFITSVKSGECHIHISDSEVKTATTEGGLLCVADNTVTFLTGRFSWL